MKIENSPCKLFYGINCKNIDIQEQDKNFNNSSDKFSVNRKGFIEADGKIKELLPSAKFRVSLKNGQEITASLSGKMRINKIMLLVGDMVKIEISPYDLTKGRVTYRY